MKKGAATRKKLVDATGELLRRQGYHATGLSEIVETSGAPRGSLYFYFPQGKEQLACEALDAAGAAWRTRIEAAIADAPDPGAAAAAACRVLADDLVASNYALGCPLATVALEASSSSPAVRATCARHFDGWHDTVVARLVAAGADRAAAAPLATFVLAAVEGATMLARVHKSPAPLLQVGAMLQALAAQSSSSPRPAGARRKPSKPTRSTRSTRRTRR